MGVVLQERSREEPGPRKWTRDEFYRAGDLGLFGPNERLELIGGEVLEKVSPQRSAHATALGLTEDEIRRHLPTYAHLRIQLPLGIGTNSDPEPDIAVVSGRRRDYEQAHPSAALLVIEIADSTLLYDRTVKASLYASAGIPEYWIVDLRSRSIEVCTSPVAESTESFAHKYAEVRRFDESDTITSEAFVGLQSKVTDLLPARLQQITPD